MPSRFIGPSRTDVAGRLDRPRDHDDRQAERARGFDLGVGRAAARVLGDDRLDRLASAEAHSASRSNGPRCAAGRMCGGSAFARAVRSAREVVMLRRGTEGAQLLAADAEEHAARRLCRARRQRLDVGTSCQRSPSLQLPWRAARARPAARRLRGGTTALAEIRRHRDAWRRRRPRSSASRSQSRQAFGAAEAADARGDAAAAGAAVRPASDSVGVEARIAGEQLAPAPRLQSCRRG